jgi:hypothetical protein
MPSRRPGPFPTTSVLTCLPAPFRSSCGSHASRTRAFAPGSEAAERRDRCRPEPLAPRKRQDGAMRRGTRQLATYGLTDPWGFRPLVPSRRLGARHRRVRR